MLAQHPHPELSWPVTSIVNLTLLGVFGEGEAMSGEWRDENARRKIIRMGEKVSVGVLIGIDVAIEAEK